jgi:hypothetical protein
MVAGCLSENEARIDLARRAPPLILRFPPAGNDWLGAPTIAVRDPNVVAALGGRCENGDRFRGGDTHVLSAVEGPRGYLRGGWTPRTAARKSLSHKVETAQEVLERWIET